MSLSIPPWSKVLIPAAINNLKESHDLWYLLEPENISFTQSGLLVEKTLVDAKHKEVPVRVLNLAERPQQINKGTLLASCKSVVGVSTMSTNSTTYHDPLPEHVQTLFNSSSATGDFSRQKFFTAERHERL